VVNAQLSPQKQQQLAHERAKALAHAAFSRSQDLSTSAGAREALRLLARSAHGGPRCSLRRGPPSRVGGKSAIASSAQPKRENHAAEFQVFAWDHRSRLSRFPNFKGGMVDFVGVECLRK